MTLDPVISPSELAALRDRSDVVIVDCRPDTSAYEAGHVRGARHAQLERDLASPTADAAHGGRHPLPTADAFATTLARWGVTPSTLVVAYDDAQGSNAASRLWWLLRALGHRDVRVVDGGLAALRDAGFELTAEPPAVTPAPAYPHHGFAAPVADIDEVEHARRAPDRRVIDVRAPFRYLGEREPIDPIAGHIPGVRNAPFADNLTPAGTFKSAAELRTQLTAALDGVAPAQAIIHCGSGVTACHTLLALERAGLPGAKLYVGSWSEWCRQPARAREPA
jgi:thiosulfate/3-mercaptopyruvate sulfurtransferase